MCRWPNGATDLFENFQATPWEPRMNQARIYSMIKIFIFWVFLIRRVEIRRVFLYNFIVALEIKHKSEQNYLKSCFGITG